MQEDYPWTDYSVSPAQALMELRAWLEQMKSVPDPSQHAWIQQNVPDHEDREALLLLLKSEDDGLPFQFESTTAA